MLKLLLILQIVFLSIGQYAVIAVVGGSKIYLFDITTLIFCLYGLFYFLNISKKYKFNRNLLLFYFFSFFAVFSLLLQIGKIDNNSLLQGFFYFLRFFLYLNFANLIWNMLDQNIIKIDFLTKIVIYSGLFVCIAGFVQLIILPDFRVLDPNLGWDPHINRLASTFFDPNFTGGYLCLLFTILLFFKNLFKSKYYYLYLIILTIGIFLTYSRSAWAMYGVIIFIYGIKQNIYLILLSLTIAFLAYFAVPRIQTRISGTTDPNDSASLRLASWKNTWEIAQDNILFGVGFNTFKTYQISYGYLDPDTLDEHNATGSDSSFLLVLATTGIVGFLVFFVAYITPFLGNNLVIITALSALFVQSQFINALFYPQIMFLWLIICCFGDYKSSQNHSRILHLRTLH